MKMKNIFLLFLLFLPVSVMGRLFQLISLTNPDTGFFLADVSNINLYMCGAFAVFAVFLFCCAFFYKQYAPEKLAPSPVLSVFSLILALAALIDLGRIIISGNSFTFLLIAQCVLLVLTVVVFCIYAVWNFTGLQVNMGALMLVPILLWTLRLVADFIAFTGMANIAENVIRVLMICTSMVFLLGHGKLVGGMGNPKNMRLTVAFGMLASALCLISTVPRYILYVVDYDKLHEGALGDSIDLALGLYIVAFLWISLTGVKKARH